MSQNWCKVSASLDSHPRIRRAGNLGRQVFEFALRRNAELDRNGVIPAEHLEADYLADILMMTSEQAQEGVSRCVRTGLLTLDNDHYVITGWDDEWGRRPLTEAERKRNQRAKVRKDEMSRKCPDTSVTESDGPECHGSEERREEEKRSERELPLADVRVHAIPPSTTHAPAALPAIQPLQPTLSWNQAQIWWQAMLESDERIRIAGIEPNADRFGKCAAHPHDANILRCARNFAAAGFAPEEVDAKMRHIVAVAEAEAIAKHHRKYFKPSLIWDPERAARAADTSLAEASASGERHSPRSSAPYAATIRPTKALKSFGTPPGVASP